MHVQKGVLNTRYGEQETALSSEATSDITLHVESVADDGTTTLRLDFVRVHGSMQHPTQGRITFDSAKSPQVVPATRDAIGLVRATLAGAGTSLQVVVSPSGRLQSIRMRASTGVIGDPGEVIRGYVVERFLPFAGERRAVGVQWDAETRTTVQDLPVRAESKHTLARVDDEAAEFTTSSRLHIVPASRCESTGEADEGASEGTFRISRRDGLPLRVTMSGRVLAQLVLGPGRKARAEQTFEETLERLPDAEEPAGADPKPGEDPGGR